MDKIYDNCCGIDVHKKLIAACFWKSNKQEVREFGATTRELSELADWLKTSDCKMAAMESTASYWMPLYNNLRIFRPECHGGQSPPYEGNPRPKDRCERCGMDRWLPSAWTAPAKLYPGQGLARAEGTRACSHKNSVKNHGKHNHRKENGTELIITGKNFPETF